jgi:succinyl-CoA synthetase alpha subunit
MIKANSYVKERNARLIGPNCPESLLQVKLSWYHARFCFPRNCRLLFLNQNINVRSSWPSGETRIRNHYSNWNWWRPIGTTTKEAVELLMIQKRMYCNDRWGWWIRSWCCSLVKADGNRKPVVVSSQDFLQVVLWSCRCNRWWIWHTS